MEQYNKWTLLSRMPGFYIRITCIVCLACNILWFVVYPEFIKELWFVILIVFIESVAVIMFLPIYKEYRKGCHILHNGKIIQTKVIKAVNTQSHWDETNVEFMFRFSPGDVYIETTYFDDETSSQYLFHGYFDLPVYSKNHLFKQGKGLNALKNLNVMVNAEDYNEYVILFIEELSELKLYE